MAKAKGSPKTGGRKKGTPNKINGDVKGMVLAALDKAGGPDYLLAQSEANPNAFMSLVGRVLPMQVAGAEEDGIIKIEIEYVAPK